MGHNSIILAVLKTIFEIMSPKKTTPSKNLRSPFHSPLIDRKYIEEKTNDLKKLKNILNQKTEYLQKREASIDNLLHELRKINSNLKDSIDQMDFDEVSPIVQDIWAQANLMSIRLRCYEYEMNPDVISSSGKFNFPVYKKIDKLRKALRDTSKEKKLIIRLRQNTYLAYRGHDILEVALFIILENAIKYALPSSDIIIVFVEEDTDLKVTFSNECESLPNDEEINRLTEYKYRGSNASDYGDGIGLHTLKTILDLEGVEMEIQIDKYRKIFTIQLIFRNCNNKPKYSN